MAVYIAIINSSVHIVMYTYYFFSSFHQENIQRVARLFKPFITIIQLVQFVIIIAHCIVAVLPACNSSYFFHLQIVNFVVLAILFGNFFVQSYVRVKKNVKEEYQMTQT